MHTHLTCRARQKLRTQCGASLSELLVAVVLLSLLALIVSISLSSSLQVYQQSTTLSESQILASTLSQTLMDELRYARDITPTGTDAFTYTSPTCGRNASFTVSDGKILLKPGFPLVAPQVYTGLSADINAVYQNGLCSVTLTLFQSSETVYTQTFTVKPLNATDQ